MNIQFVVPRGDNAPSWFLPDLQAAASIMDRTFTDNITVTINAGWGEIGGTPITDQFSISQGGPLQYGAGMNYSQLTSSLATNATSYNDQTMLANLPTTDPTNGGKFYVPAALLQAWGTLPANGVLITGQIIDGQIGFNANVSWATDPNNQSVSNEYSFVGDAMAEIRHALYASPDGNGGYYSIMDLTRYSAPGLLRLDETNPGSAYFSTDGGKTDLGDYDTGGADHSDFQNDQGSVSGNGYINSPMAWDTNDLVMADVMGYAIAGSTPMVPAPKFINDNSPDAEIYRLYKAAFSRLPDPSGDSYWVNDLSNNQSLDQIAAGFTQSPEFQSEYANLSTSDFVTQLYANILDRTPDPGGQQFWTTELQTGQMSQSQVLIGFSDSLENRTNVLAHTS